MQSRRVHRSHQSLFSTCFLSDSPRHAISRGDTTSPPTASTAVASVSAPPSTSPAKPSQIPPGQFHLLATLSFSIIAHIDHGKSTLADRLLEQTGVISERNVADDKGINRQVLDTLQVERERGITVKSQCVSMVHRHNDGKDWLLNLIDTPGHVDVSWTLVLFPWGNRLTKGETAHQFSYEVARSLSACQTALLLIDATQGIQAQTLSVFRVATAQRNPAPLRIIPVINKIDLPNADVGRCVRQMRDLLGLDVRMPMSQGGSKNREVDRQGQGSATEPILISAKTGQGVSSVLTALVSGPLPTLSAQSAIKLSNLADLRAQIFDSYWDQFRGVVVLVSVRSGTLRKGEKIVSSLTGKKYDVIALGVQHPGPVETKELRAGQIGWLIANMRNVADASIGDVLKRPASAVTAAEGGGKQSESVSAEQAAQLAELDRTLARQKQQTTPMVFAGLYPSDSSGFGKLEESIRKLALNDRSVSIARESSAALGQGCRCGFLGTLHLDVFRQRLQDEYRHQVLVTAPTVTYRLRYKEGMAPVKVRLASGKQQQQAIGKDASLEQEHQSREEADAIDLNVRLCSNPADFPDEHTRKSVIEAIEEPMVRGELRCPQECVGDMMALCAEHRGTQLEYDFGPTFGGVSAASTGASVANDDLAEEQHGARQTVATTAGGAVSVSLVYRLPLAEIMTDFYDRLKSRSSGFASFEYTPDGYAASELVHVSFLVSGTPVDALSTICHRSQAHTVGKRWAAKLKEAIPRQQYEVAIQAVAQGKVIARETISAYRKDVTSGVGGGHYDRKLKHIKKQKEGKKRLRAMSFGRVQIPLEAFQSVLDRS